LYSIYFKIKSYLLKELFKEFWEKFIWVVNNFLRIECYRKLCNNLYWKQLKPGTVSSKTRFWMIVATAVSAIWLSFYFDPTDPTSMNSTAKIIRLLELIMLVYSVLMFTQFVSVVKPITSLRTSISSILNVENIFLRHSRKTYLKTRSLLI